MNGMNKMDERLKKLNSKVNSDKGEMTIKEALVEMAKVLDFDPDKVISLMYTTDPSNAGYSDEDKTIIGEMALMKLFLQLEPVTLSIMAMILNELTGLEMKDKADLVKYISKSMHNPMRLSALSSMLIQVANLNDEKTRSETSIVKEFEDFLEVLNN